ncbi:MAG: DUF2167 domain-containing protein [Hyphomicrobiales bacterium]|nr:DUF2167 domain-containing protein [Hyphomicrobiales bacterium]
MLALAPALGLDHGACAQSISDGNSGPQPPLPQGTASPQQPPSPEQRAEEERAAWSAAIQAQVRGPQEIPLIDQGSLSLPAGLFFVPKAPATRFMRAIGNVVHPESFIGLVASSKKGDEWFARLSFIKEGYVNDEEARKWNADDLLANLKEGTERNNEDRAARGFPALEVLGWVEPPIYDAKEHRLVWSLSLKDRGADAHEGQTVNYNTYLLGRNGYFSVDFITSLDRIEVEKPTARELLADLSFAPGKRYEDFNSSTDKIAAYGIGALVGGLVAKKLGLLALAGVFILKFAKIFALAAAGIGAGVVKFFRGRSSPGSGTKV